MLRSNKPRLYQSTDVDLLTWRAIIEQALTEMYGISGLARHYDLMVKQTNKPALSAIVRVVPDDVKVFATSLAGFSCNLADFLGREYDVNATVAFVDDAAFLGLLADQLLIVTQ